MDGLKEAQSPQRWATRKENAGRVIVPITRALRKVVWASIMARALFRCLTLEGTDQAMVVGQEVMRWRRARRRTVDVERLVTSARSTYIK